MKIATITRWVSGIAICAGLLENGLRAQNDVITPVPQTQTQPLTPFGVQPVADPSLLFAQPPPTPFEYGPLDVMPHFLYRFMYGDGVPASPGKDYTTAINSFSPGVLLKLGNWSIDYAPTWNYYSNSVFKNTVEEYEKAAGLIVTGASSIRLTQMYTYTSEPLVETGRQTTQQLFSESGDFTHRFTQEVFSETVLSESSRLALGFPDSNDWSATQWLHYQFSPQFDTAVGASAGYIGVSAGTDIYYLQPQGQISWSPTKKVSLVATGGLDHREFLVTPRENLNTPIYNVALQYNPFDWTGISVSTGRDVEESYFENQSTKNTLWRATVSQRFLEHFMFIGAVEQRRADYILNLDAKYAGREDSTLACNGRLTWSVLKRGTISLLYRWDRNDSTIPGYGFSSHQEGFEIGYHF